MVECMFMSVQFKILWKKQVNKPVKFIFTTCGFTELVSESILVLLLCQPWANYWQDSTVNCIHSTVTLSAIVKNLSLIHI